MHYMSSKAGVDSLSHLPFRARHTQKVTDAIHHHNHGTAADTDGMDN